MTPRAAGTQPVAMRRPVTMRSKPGSPAWMAAE